MSDHCPPTVVRNGAAHRPGPRTRFFLGLAVFTLLRIGETMAADQPSTMALDFTQDVAHPTMPFSAAPFALHSFAGTRDTGWADIKFAETRPDLPSVPPSLLSLPDEYSLPQPADAAVSTGAEFRPRAHSIFDREPRIGSANDDLIIDKTVWQRLQEYRNRDRVRVLTLWESGVSTVSLQTDRRGGPSLQWTSRWMNRGGATRGILDRWVPTSVFRSFSHPEPSSPNKTVATPLMKMHSGAGSVP